jgi:hypothetical protein
MAGPWLSWDKQNSRRRWVIVATAFTLVILLLTATSHYHPLRPSSPYPYSVKDPSTSPSPSQAVNHTPQSQAADHVPSAQPTTTTVSSPEFVKPEGIPVVAYIFFGRRSRVELLRCYIEVRKYLPFLSSQRDQLIPASAIWSIMVAGLMKSTGCEIQKTRKIWLIYKKS